MTFERGESRAGSVSAPATRGVLEAGIRFHRTYGVPVIPGSAQKGLVLRMARRLWDTEKAEKLLGRGGDKGLAAAVTFHDALWNPESEDGPFLVDTITVHHPEYYRGEAPPADWDSPTPLGMLAARGTFLFAIEGHPSARQLAMKLLATSLRDEGIGARTLKGYGRFTVGEDALPVDWNRLPLFHATGAAAGVAAAPGTPRQQKPQEYTVEGAVVSYQPNTGRFELKILHEGKERKVLTVPSPRDLLHGNNPDEKTAALEALRSRCRKKGLVLARVRYEVIGTQITPKAIEPEAN